MKRNMHLYKMTAAAFLIAIGILIPMVSPIRIMLEPASFTLASHVPIFLSMFISPAVAAVVSLGTTLGFFIGGFPLVVVLRAATQIVFAVVGAWAIKKWPKIVEGPIHMFIYSLLIGVIHAAGEMAVVSVFYFSGSAGTAYYAKGFVFSVLMLVGLGTVVHSIIDFAIAMLILKAVSKQRQSSLLFTYSPFIKPVSPKV